jgi:hypothetical protein
MMTFEEFQILYQTELKDEVEVLERQRKQFLNRYFLSLALTVIVSVFSILFLPVALLLQCVLGIFIFLAGCYFTRGQYRKFRKNYALEYKQQIISKMIGSLEGKLAFYPEYGISRDVFIQSGVVKGNVDWYASSDYFEGEIDGVPIYFSEVLAKSKERDPETRHESYSELFRGILFAADFNKRITSQLVVFPNIFGGRVGRFIARHVAAPKDSELISLEDPEFAEHFVVYGKDQVEARFILSTAFMKRLLDVRAKYRYFSVSFIENQIFIGLFIKKNLFEPPVFTTLHNTKILEEYLQYLTLVIGLVEDLKMNAKIWKVN